MFDPTRTLPWSVGGLLVLGALSGLAGCAGPAPGYGAPDEEPTPPDLTAKALVVEDVASGWPGLFGPTGSSVSGERDLALEWGAAGPPVVWRRLVGRGYSAPVVLGNRLVVFYRDGDEEVVDCADALDVSLSDGLSMSGELLQWAV